jgi:hypothetical protein
MATTGPALANTWGCAWGLFRPYPLLVVTQRIYRLMRNLKLRPIHAEVAHLV